MYVVSIHVRPDLNRYLLITADVLDDLSSPKTAHHMWTNYPKTICMQIYVWKVIFFFNLSSLAGLFC